MSVGISSRTSRRTSINTSRNISRRTSIETNATCVLDIFKNANNLNRYKIVQLIVSKCIKGDSEYLKIFGKTSKFHKGTDWFKFGYYKIRDAINALDSCFFNNSNSESNSKQFKPNSIDINLSHIEQITHEKGAIRHQMKVMLLLLLYCCMNSIYKQLNENLKYYLKKSLDNSLSKKDRFTYTKLAIIQFLSDYNAIALHSNNEQNLLKYADNQTVTDLVNLLLVKLSSDHYLNETNIHALEQRKTMLEKINQNMIDKQNLDLQISELQNTIANLRKSK